MSAPLLVVQALATLACLVVAWRAFCVVAGMNLHARGATPYLHWLLFGLGYCLLGLCAVGSLVSIWQDTLQIGYVIWPVASAMLIVFDRRPRRARHSQAAQAVREESCSAP